MTTAGTPPGLAGTPVSQVTLDAGTVTPKAAPARAGTLR